jgi:hypothetical protein
MSCLDIIVSLSEFVQNPVTPRALANMRKQVGTKSTHKEVLAFVSKKEGRPDVHFVDVGKAFMDSKIERQREKAALHRAEQRHKRQQKKKLRILSRA